MLDVALRVERRRFAVEASFQVGAGERLGLFGPSGSGKSTVLDAVAGVVPLDGGRVVLEGRDLAGVPLWDRRVGLLRQRPGLFPHLSVAENVRYGIRRRPDGDGGELAVREAALCERLGIGGLLSAYPSQLSGGQAQRVALARALQAPARALLLDEPFQGLDAPLRAELVHLVRDEAAERALPVVLVAHELAEVQAFAERIGVLAGGRLLQVAGAAELVRRPATAEVARLVGYVAVLPAGRGGELVGVHPDRVRFGRAPEGGPVLEGRIGRVVPHGARFLAEVQLAGQPVMLGCDLVPGEPGAAVQCTLVDPPRFGPDGRLVGGAAEPEPRPAAVGP